VWWPGIVDYTAQMQAAYLTWLSYGQRSWPAVNVVFAILAGGGPFQLERLASRGVTVRSGLHENVYFDTASYGRRAIELCIETFGVHQLVYGSDAPVIDTGPTLRAVRGFGESVVQLLTTDNPSTLLP
jgi:predicted TIM-barrel fold metal-dependent hydrolase